MRIQREWTCKRPFLLAGMIAFAASLAAVFLPTWACVAIACVLPLVLFLRVCRSPAGLFGVCCGVLFLLLGLWQRAYRVQPVEQLAGQTDVITGVVQDCPDSGHFYTLRVTQAQKLPAGSRVLLYCSDTAAPALYETVSGEVQLEALYSSQYTRWADGVFLVAYPTAYGEEALSILPPPRLMWTYPFTLLRQQMAQDMQSALPGDTGAVLAGICLGEVGGLSASTDEQFRNSGLPHLLVVSGLHLSMLAVSILGFFRLCRVGRRLSALLAMGILPLFMLLVGLSPSVVRAGVACFVMLVGRVFRRQADGLNSLGLALVLLMAQDPYACVDVGLQLSFAAAAGVLVITPRLQEALNRRCPQGDTLPARVGRFLWKSIAAGVAVSCGATLFLTPLLCLYFGRISLFTLLANLLAVMPAGWALILGYIAVLLAGIPFLQPVGQVLLHVAGLVCRWLQAVAGWFGGAGTTLYAGQLWHIVFAVCACLLLTLGWIWGTPSLRRYTACFLSVLLLAASFTAQVLRGDAVTLRLLPAGESAAILLERQGEYGLIVTDAEALWQAGRAVANSPCEQLDFILLTGMDTAHAATLKELLDTVPTRHTVSLPDADWAVGFPHTITALPADTGFVFWDSCSLAVLSDGWWRLDVADSSLLFCPAEGADTLPAPSWAQAGGVLFFGEPPSIANELKVGQGILICEADTLPQAVLSLPDGYPVAALTEEPCYLTTRGNGEWSITRWQ